MSKWEVVYKSNTEIEAEDLVSAKEAFKSKHPSNKDSPMYFIDGESGEKYDVIGICEICDLPIINTEDYQSDEDGINMHIKCLEESESDDGITSTSDPDGLYS